MVLADASKTATFWSPFAHPTVICCSTRADEKPGRFFGKKKSFEYDTKTTQRT